jgi:hypothetical protein
MAPLRIDGDYPHDHLDAQLDDVLHALDALAGEELGDVHQATVAQKVDERAVRYHSSHLAQSHRPQSGEGALRAAVGDPWRGEAERTAPAELEASPPQGRLIGSGGGGSGSGVFGRFRSIWTIRAGAGIRVRVPVHAAYFLSPQFYCDGSHVL